MLTPPIDPLPGEIFEAPDDTPLGESIIIQVIGPQGTIVGLTEGTSKVENVSRKWSLGRTTTVIPLFPKMRIRVRGIQKHITALVFNEYYGWSPYSYAKDIIVTDTSFIIEHTTPLFSSEDHTIYEKVLLTAVEDADEKI
ncbi:MAG: hypothetical protein DRP01_00180 [Archaeoglobales archaeon]|nr:MAG: hypothetical protein DRP01_00180 [Archaeoglobales archaeon]